jgi:putative ABC transport system permease protein
MAVLLRIAWRNLREHRAKTLIVGLIIAFGIALLIFGNALMTTAARGAKGYFIDNFTGHLMIHGKGERVPSIFGYTMVSTGTEVIPRVPEYDEVYRYIVAQPEVADAAPQISSYAMLDLAEKGSAFLMLFGIEPESYRGMFPAAVTIAAGSDLAPGEEGILLSEYKQKQIEQDYGVRLSVGDTVVLNGFGSAGFRIREVPIRGIFHFDRSIEGMNEINFVDAETHRALLGLTVAGAADVELVAGETELLASQSPDDLFGEEIVGTGQAESGRTSEKELLEILGERDPNSYRASLDSGAWHFLLVRLKSDSQLKRFQDRLNRHFAESGIAAQASDWRAASGGFGAMAEMVQSVFNGAILVIAVVAIIIIMNTLVISVIERTAEIGTMRALGAQKRTVRWMFVLETLSISVVFGGIGILVSCLAVVILNLTGLPAPNSFFEMLFGGEKLHPELQWTSVVFALGIVAGIGVLASLYPVSVALKIQPVRAIQAE